MKKALVYTLIGVLAVAAFLSLIGEPTDSSWRAFWVCLAYKPIGLLFAYIAYRIWKAGVKAGIINEDI